MEIKKISQLFCDEINGNIILPNKDIDGNYTNHPEYFILTVEIEYVNGNIRYILCTQFLEFNFKSKVVKIVCDEFIKIAGFEIESIANIQNKIFPNGFMLIDNNEYVYSGGQYASMIEPNPYEDDLGKEILQNVLQEDNVTILQQSYNPKQYEQKLKKGLITNFEFWFKYLKPLLIVPIQQRIAYYATTP